MEWQEYIRNMVLLSQSNVVRISKMTFQAQQHRFFFGRVDKFDEVFKSRGEGINSDYIWLYGESCTEFAETVFYISMRKTK